MVRLVLIIVLVLAWPLSLRADSQRALGQGKEVLRQIVSAILASPARSFHLDVSGYNLEGRIGASASIDVSYEQLANQEIDGAIGLALTIGEKVYPIEWTNLGWSSYLTAQTPSSPVFTFRFDPQQPQKRVNHPKDGLTRTLEALLLFAKVEFSAPGVLEFIAGPNKPVRSRLYYDEETFLPKAWHVENSKMGTRLLVSISNWANSATIETPLPIENYVPPSKEAFTDIVGAYRQGRDSRNEETPVENMGNIEHPEFEKWSAQCEKNLADLKNKGEALKLYRLRWRQAFDGVARLKAGNMTPTVQKELAEAFGNLGAMTKAIQGAQIRQSIGARLRAIGARFRGAGRRR